MPQDYQAAFKFKDPNKYDDWVTAAMLLKGKHGDDLDAYAAWVNWSRCAGRTEEACVAQWNSFASTRKPSQPSPFLAASHSHLVEAFSRWENDFREKPEGFYTAEETAALEVATLSESRAITLKAYLREVRATEGANHG